MDMKDKAQLYAYKMFKKASLKDKLPFAIIYGYSQGRGFKELNPPLIKNSQEEVKEFERSFSKGKESSKVVLHVFYATQFNKLKQYFEGRNNMNEELKLYHKNGKEVKVGDEVVDFRGEKAIVVSTILPKHEGSSGRVCVKQEGENWERCYYPSVFDLEWKEAIVEDIELKGSSSTTKDIESPTKNIKDIFKKAGFERIPLFCDLNADKTKYRCKIEADSKEELEKTKEKLLAAAKELSISISFSDIKPAVYRKFDMRVIIPRYETQPKITEKIKPECPSCHKLLGKDGHCYNYECDEYDPLSQYFENDGELIKKEISKVLDEATNTNFGEKAWQLNEIIEHMNDEEAYWGNWLYVWPDGSSKQEAIEIFSAKPYYDELEKVFKEVYKEYHKDGLYKASSTVVARAHEWDKKLGLPEIEAIDTINEEKLFLKEALFQIGQTVTIKMEDPENVWDGLTGTVEEINEDEDINWITVLVDFPAEDGEIKPVRQAFNEKELVLSEE